MRLHRGIAQTSSVYMNAARKESNLTLQRTAQYVEGLNKLSTDNRLQD
jgi:hypothetical protein